MKKILKLSINKEIFEKILSRNLYFFEKEATNYWKKELFEAKIDEKNIVYNLCKFDKIILTNGLGDDKPQITVELENLEYDKTKGVFVFYFGKILEQKNILNLEDDKDILIKKLLDEKKELIKIIDEIKKINILR